MTNKDWTIENEHGIKGWVEMDTFIPQCCFNCQHFDGGEYGDYGVIHSHPYCLKSIFFPVRKGDCRGKEEYPPNKSFVANC